MTPTDKDIWAALAISMSLFKLQEEETEQKQSFQDWVKKENLPKLDDEEPYTY
jgi:hypothetical protein